MSLSINKTHVPVSELTKGTRIRLYSLNGWIDPDRIAVFDHYEICGPREECIVIVDAEDPLGKVIIKSFTTSPVQLADLPAPVRRDQNWKFKKHSESVRDLDFVGGIVYWGDFIVHVVRPGSRTAYCSLHIVEHVSYLRAVDHICDNCLEKPDLL